MTHRVGTLKTVAECFYLYMIQIRGNVFMITCMIGDEKIRRGIKFLFPSQICCFNCC